MGMFESIYRHDGWSIGLMRGGATALLADTPAIEWLPIDGRNAFAADPFLIEEDGRLWCFFEALPYASDRGKICYVDVHEAHTGRLTVRDAIVAPFHLSYPFLLRHDGEILCIPEANESGRITVYAAHDFPGGWTEKCTLIDDFAGVDSTFFHHEDRWWLFATDGRSGWNDALHIWYADTLFGTWRRHARNPVKRGLAGTRPGGRPFVSGGRLYRPAQDCSARYGGALIVNEIVTLSPEQFEERPVNTLAPDRDGPYPDGLHTANVCGDVIAVDGNRFHCVPRQGVRAIARRLRRLLAKVPAS